MAENQFTSTIDTLFRGMDQFVNTKTVVGEPVQVGDTIIVPVSYTHLDVYKRQHCGCHCGCPDHHIPGGLCGKEYQNPDRGRHVA